jgi:hypothetical protein
VGRWGTWLVVAALAGLGLAATLDAFVGEEEPSSRSARPTSTEPLLARQPELAVSQLREAGVSGLLTFSDEDCRLHAVSLPELEPVRAPSFESCEPHVPSGGIGTLDGDVVWSGLGFQTVQVVLSKELLTSELERAREALGGYVARQAVSLDGERVAVVAASVDVPGERIVALFRNGRFDRVAATFVREEEVIRPSPRGTQFAVLDPGEPGVTVFDTSGHVAPLPDVTRPHAVAWSPDDRWTALATRWSVFVFPTTRPDEVVRIPLAVRDLDWGE